MNAHTLRSHRYYGTQQLRPNVPVFPQPNAKDVARRSWSSGVRFYQHDSFVRKEPELRQSRVTDMEDITSDLKPTLPSQSNEVHRAQRHSEYTDKSGRARSKEGLDEGHIDLNWMHGESIDEERSLDEDFGMVKYEDDLTEGFEEVGRDIPVAFNGKPPK